jgi:predicted peroxiredoxin
MGLERESLICQFTGVPRLEEASMPIVIAKVAAMSGWDVLVGRQ